LAAGCILVAGCALAAGCATLVLTFIVFFTFFLFVDSGFTALALTFAPLALIFAPFLTGGEAFAGCEPFPLEEKNPVIPENIELGGFP